jgi:protein gp37
MADASAIEWTDATWQPITGCSVVSPGCTNCYAMKLAGTRLQHHPSRAGLTTMSKAGPVWNGQVRFNEQWAIQPLGWSKPRRIFVCAHGDLFHESVPDEWIDKVFAVMALAPQHTFQVLTKRAKRMREYLRNHETHYHIMDLVCELTLEHTLDVVLIAGPQFEEHAPAGPKVRLSEWPIRNVWLGVSAEDQKRANERIPDLLATPAAVRFVSAEPLLSAINLRRLRIAPDHHTMIDALDGYAIADSISGSGQELTQLDWVIVGGESGKGARPMHPDWARSLRDQCAAAAVPYFFKQWGAWAPSTPEQSAANPRSGWQANKPHPCVAKAADLYPDAGAAFVANVGKKAAGRLLDGVEHNGMPEARA